MRRMRSAKRLVVIAAAIGAAMTVAPAAAGAASAGPFREGPPPVTDVAPAYQQWTSQPYVTYQDCARSQDWIIRHGYIVVVPCDYNPIKGAWFFVYRTAF